MVTMLKSQVRNSQAANAKSNLMTCIRQVHFVSCTAEAPIAGTCQIKIQYVRSTCILNILYIRMFSRSFSSFSKQ
jgi:hypothetical protein